MFLAAIGTGLVLAQESGTETQVNPLGFLLPIIVIGGIFYLLLVLPQRRRMKRMEEMRSAIGIGDEIRTVGGIYGFVRAEDDDTFTIDVGGGTTMRIAKRAVAEKIESTEA